MTEFTLKKTVHSDLESTFERVKTLLAAEGFGTLYSLDFSDIIRAKTNLELPGRVIGFGVCNPSLAHQALSLETSLAAMLPCGAFIAETAEGTQVGFLDPVAVLKLADQPALEALGQEVRQRLKRALNAL
jgi:uncharacterized protein (DUF302 family)